jgi:hypothetical protein
MQILEGKVLPGDHVTVDFDKAADRLKFDHRAVAASGKSKKAPAAAGK